LIKIETYYVYPIYTGILALIFVVLVPRNDIKHLLIYAITFGGVTNVALIGLVGKLLGVGGHINYGAFGAFGIPFFPPLAWTIWFVIFFYFLPNGLLWIVIYVLTAASTSVLFANVLVNLHVLKFNYGLILVPFLTYVLWFSLVTWAFKHLTRHIPN
jgi:hypothetical protein